MVYTGPIFGNGRTGTGKKLDRKVSGCRTTDNVLVLRTLLHRAKKKSEPLKAVFVDLRKAYDMIPRYLN